MYDHEPCDFRATQRREIATCPSLPLDAEATAVEVIKGVRISVNPSQPSIGPGADVAPDEAKTSLSLILHSLCPGPSANGEPACAGFY